RFSILLLLTGIVLAGAVISHAGGIIQPAPKSQSSGFDLHADALSLNLKNDNLLPERDPPSPASLAFVEQDQSANELVSAKQHPEPAKSDPQIDGTPDLPPDEPMPESNPEPKMVVDDRGPAKDLPDTPIETGEKPETEVTKDVTAVEEKLDEIKLAVTENTE